MADQPPSQSSIDALNNATPDLADLADIAQCTYMHGRSTPQSIKHRYLEYHYTKLGRSSRYMYGRSTPQSIKHRCLEYCYTKLGRSSRYSTMHICAWQIDPPSQLSIHALNTTTPNSGDLPQRTSTYERPFTHEGNYLVHLFSLLLLVFHVSFCCCCNNTITQ